MIPETLSGLFQSAVAAAPDAPAIRRCGADPPITYAELASRAQVVAAAVSEAVSGGSRVGISLTDPTLFPETAIGVLEAGCTYVPLDPAYPAARLAFMIEDADLAVVLSDAAAASTLPDQTPRLELESLSPTAMPRGPAAADDPAYIIYTSGSTGTPKGVVVTQRNVLALIRSTIPLFDFKPSDVWTLFHSYCFDFSVWEMWGALATSAQLVPVPIETRRSAAGFMALLRDSQVTVLNVVPSVFKYLVDDYTQMGRPSLSLRYVIFGGEPIDRKTIRDWLHETDCGPQVINMYGITEGTVHSTFARLDPQELDRLGEPTDIGSALPHVELRVVDDDHGEVGCGIAGEIVIGGEGVAAGYHNREELTQAKFRELSFDGVGRSRYYCSGDVARRRPDGGFDYLGRVDDQVKILGARIELGEIESAINDLPGVVDAAVATVPGPRGDPVLVALYVASDTDPAELRDALAARLPASLMPARLRRVDAIPLTPSGKRDRERLAAIMRGGSHE